MIIRKEGAALRTNFDDFKCLKRTLMITTFERSFKDELSMLRALEKRLKLLGAI